MPISNTLLHKHANTYAGLVRTFKHALTLLEIISLPARLVFTPTQIVNLKVVAPQLRSVFVSAVSFVWNISAS